ncbi:hypothetical protein EHW99_0183 [Erwinia amylovora]|uniref:Uncharacterized protein n=2 Tax=Erwinia amylovora TaxID=552 RepID=A0A830ZXK3_ERWAM|nr:hypothetical protein EaACW_0188 [Erwinia amylovora ACW56400]QJQ52890.1 hypothetical protein EHX00_0183 [Erwinia amylovora]CBA19125.1 hypothetical protein predicted by Glimmer/Critica [Erwinia amylovora CFBP1430]CBJ44851.1 hypothetical protein EAM_0176 [Erwinia amylovora ATCC 49946]CCO77033.1 hypothetical protein BN432_0193 [Erwinia amylovora Ea356]CCO80813.1 hypothetical protein BN433_0198 [Erwinia amylovora Ea266]CCO84621.1 hypothetical protein BN434_0190 [Erwinia amylovora CFBP 2585]CCO
MPVFFRRHPNAVSIKAVSERGNRVIFLPQEYLAGETDRNGQALSALLIKR